MTRNNGLKLATGAFTLFIAASAVGTLVQWLLSRQSPIIHGLMFGVLFTAVVFLLKGVRARLSARAAAAAVLVAAVVVLVIGVWQVSAGDVLSGWILVLIGAVSAFGHLIDLMLEEGGQR